MANRRNPSGSSRAPKKFGAWLALFAALGLSLASGHGLHAHERSDLRGDPPKWSASEGRVAGGQADLHDGTLCSACRSRSDAKLAVATVPGIAGELSERSHCATTLRTTPRATGRWQDAPAPPRAPPTA